jgi:hypothetical protein
MHATIERRREDPSVSVRADGGDPLVGHHGEPQAAGRTEREQATTVVTGHIQPVPGARARTPMHPATDDRARVRGVRVVEDGQDVPTAQIVRVALARLELERALAVVPSEVRALPGLASVITGSHEVHLLAPFLAGIADPEVARARIEREAPWVAKP